MARRPDHAARAAPDDTRGGQGEGHALSVPAVDGDARAFPDRKSALQGGKAAPAKCQVHAGIRGSRGAEGAGKGKVVQVRHAGNKRQSFSLGILHSKSKSIFKCFEMNLTCLCRRFTSCTNLSKGRTQR